MSVNEFYLLFTFLLFLSLFLYLFTSLPHREGRGESLGLGFPLLFPLLEPTDADPAQREEQESIDTEQRQETDIGHRLLADEIDLEH